MNEFSGAGMGAYGGGQNGGGQPRRPYNQPPRQMQQVQQVHQMPQRQQRQQYQQAQQHQQRQQRQQGSVFPQSPVSGAMPEEKGTSSGNGVPSMGRSISSLLNNIQLDEEKVIIIFLIVILARSGADLPLLAALGYLLM